MTTKRALICGVSGQDGAYLSQLLLSKGYEVYGGSRDAQNANFSNLAFLGIKDKVRFVSITITDFRSVLENIIRIKPDEIYNLAGQSSVALSFEQPVETLESIGLGTLNLLEAIRFSKLPIRLYSAGSSECFGNSTSAVDETSPFTPRSPYGVAKSTAFWEVANYREAYKIFACTGILFNHESPLRKERFVTKKVIAAACKVGRGEKTRLQLGNLHIQRDWGWAPEYVEAMYMMLQRDVPDDYIIATGVTSSLEDFVATAFDYFGLDWQEHTDIDESLLRPTDISVGAANPSKAKRELGWEAKVQLKELIKLLIESELKEMDAASGKIS